VFLSDYARVKGKKKKGKKKPAKKKRKAGKK